MYRRAGRKVWYCSFSDTEKHISLGTEDEAEAREEFAQRLESRRHLELAPGEKSLTELVVTLRARAEKANTPKTAYELHLNLRRVLAWLEERGIFTSRQVTATVVEDYKTARRFKVGPSRINRELDSWRRLMRLAIELRCASRDALASFQKLREPRPEPHRLGLTKRDLGRFLKAVDDPGYRALFRLVLGSALRDEEMRHMQPSDLRPKRRGTPEIVVTPRPGWTTKGYRYRSIPVTPATIRAGEAFLAAKESLNMDKKAVWKVMRRACAKAGVKRFSLQELRRSWASHMLAAGHRIEDISRWLGHADVMTTMRYLRVVMQKLPPPKSLPW
jgi:integrase